MWNKPAPSRWVELGDRTIAVGGQGSRIHRLEGAFGGGKVGGVGIAGKIGIAVLVHGNRRGRVAAALAVAGPAAAEKGGVDQLRSILIQLGDENISVGGSEFCWKPLAVTGKLVEVVMPVT